MQTGELHYLTHHDRQRLNEGTWDQFPGLFIPSTILDLCFEVFPSDLTSDMIHSVAVLAWLPVHLVEEYFSKQKRKIQDTLANDILREKPQIIRYEKKSIGVKMQGNEFAVPFNIGKT